MKKELSILLLVLVTAVAGFFCGKNVSPNASVVVNTNVTSNELTEWEVMKMAIIKTESEFDPLAVGKSNDWGIFQITPIYVKEVNRIIGEEKYCHEDAFNPEKSMTMFNVMQSRHNPESDVDKAIASHNPTATSAYSVKVRRNMEFIRQYESLRKLVK